MHNHNNNDNSSSMMMWMMVLCCALPIIVLVLFSRQTVSQSSWLTFGVMAVFVVGHLWLMKKSRHHSVDSKNDKDGNNSHSSRGCH